MKRLTHLRGLRLKHGTGRRWLATRVVCGLCGVLLCAVVSGCGKSDSADKAIADAPPVARPADPVDLTQFEKAFATASPGMRVFADEVAAVIRARAYPDALEQLQKMSNNQTLTSEQRQAVTGLTASVRALARGRTP
jgi:hypothetical protein